MTLEENLKRMLGGLMFQRAQAQTEIQRLGEEIAQLKAPPEKKPE